MHDEHEEHDHEHGEGSELELETQSQIFLEMRQQNLELLRIAAQVAGFAGQHGPLKPNDVDGSLRNLWKVYSELYTWIDPEESEDDEDEEE